MLDDLAGATDLAWQAREGGDKSGVLISGFVELVLTAVAAKSVEMSVDAVVDAVREVRMRWLARRLDPPEITIDTETVPDDDTDDEGDTPSTDDAES